MAGKSIELSIVTWSLIVSFTAMVGCAEQKPRPMQQPGAEQVKGSADRSFDKLKQEERERKAVGNN